MAHSIELLFDDETDAALRQVWDSLAAEGVPSQVRVASPTNRPHVTVTVADRIAADVDAELTALAHHLPMPCHLGAPLAFGHLPKPTHGPEGTSRTHHFVGFGVGRFTLAHLIVPSTALLELQREVHLMCVPHMATGPFPHAEPGQWTPHATLGRRLTAQQLAQALVSVPGVTRPRPAMFVGLRRWDGDAKTDHLLIS